MKTRRQEENSVEQNNEDDLKDVLYFTVLDGETIEIYKERIYDEYYGLHRLDNRWEPDETDKIMNAMKGKWKTDQYVGFVDQSIYYPELYDHNDDPGEDMR